MKKITLLVAVILLVANVAKASVSTTADVTINNRYGANEPIEFVERGILFYVFPNGDFDFNTRPNDSHGDYYYRGANRNQNQNSNRENFGVLIENDSFGRIRRVGNTFINYDYNNRVARIGSVFMRYNRFALIQIGGLKLVYNRFGTIIDSYGSVKGFRNQGFTNSSYNTNGNYNSGHFNNYTDDDNEYQYFDNNASYYYKTDGSKVKIEDNKTKFKDDSVSNRNNRR